MSTLLTPLRILAALHSRQDELPGGLTAQQIAEIVGDRSARTLERHLTLLSASGITYSTPGKCGGHRLRASMHMLTVGDVRRALRHSSAPQYDDALSVFEWISQQSARRRLLAS